ncbi:MAG TPA: dihydrolipoamide acetyltransferase family protein [Rugosimonospora sp.]
MARLLRMPEISANTAEAVLSAWPLPENAAFSGGDAIATVETEKAVVDVPADSDGVLLKTLIEPGAAVAVGTPMAVLGEPGEVVDDLDALVARLTGAEPLASVPASDSVPVTGSAPGTGSAAASRVFASPLARRIARENGLPVESIAGTGPGGRIVRDDVRRAIEARPPAVPPAPPAAPATPHPVVVPAAPPPPPAAARAPSPSVPAAPGAAAPGTPDLADPAVSAAWGPTAASGDYRDIPHSRMRRAIASRLVESNREAPHFAIRGSARIDALLALRADLNASVDVRVSVTDLVVAAAARAHVAVPEMNVIWTPDAIRSYRSVDIAVAVATDAGLVTPVLRDVPAMTISALSRANADLASRARDGALRQDELEGGTLTVTNLGMFGTEDFTAVINPPHAAILAVGAARPEAVVNDGELGIATVLRVTLSVDHRPVDGAVAARWMAAFLSLLESPLRILA